MATERLRTGTPVTSLPSSRMRPWLGRSSPAISRIKLVFPDKVGPSSTFIVPRVSASDTSLMNVSPPTAKLTFSSVRSKGHSSKYTSCRLLLGKRTRNAVTNGSNLHTRQAQTELGAPPQDVVSRHRPFGAHQIPYLSFREVGTQDRAQIGKRPRRPDQIMNPCAIGPEQPA